MVRNREQSCNKFITSGAYVTLGDREHKAMADQLGTVRKRRLTDLAGQLSVSDLRRVEQAIKVQLALS